MSSPFQDSEGKRTIREQWDTPILNHFRQQWESLFFYFGMPGRLALDIMIWKDLIRRIVAFELEENGNREDIIELRKILGLLGIPHALYCGFFEDVLIRKMDLDGKRYEQDEIVTLYNLDFCDSITSKIVTKTGSRCLRFEALRSLLNYQHQLSQSSQGGRFIFFLTVRDQMHTNEIWRFLRRDAAQSIKEFNNLARKYYPINKKHFQRNTPLTKAFVFHTLRSYFQGHGIKSYFYPLVRYTGASSSSRMLHFAILCSFDPPDVAHPEEIQSAEDFLKSKSYEVQGSSINVSPLGAMETIDIGGNHPNI